MSFLRSSGVLLHPTSFPGRFGIGDLGLEAYRFVDFLVNSRQQLWQILPLGPTGYGNSPYMSFSAIGGNPLLISPELLKDDGLLTDEDFHNLPEFSATRVDFGQVERVKMPLFRLACDRFKTQASPIRRTEFEGFCESKAYWLEDHALFMALKDAHDDLPWNTWEPPIAQRQTAALQEWREKLQGEIFFQKYLQFAFFQQWAALKSYANLRGIEIIGDIPIYVAHNSADVWAHPENFCLDPETGEPTLMAGVPPDYFSNTGQLWGNPVYNWEHLQQSNFKWWVQRFQSMLDYVDLIRIDHFRGFQAFWAIPQGEETALNGTWIEAPGAAFFRTLQQTLGRLPIMAEDLGVMTPEVEELRDEFNFPGMRILHFAFGSDIENPFLPFNYPRNCVVYTGTHDNDTTVGWFNQLSDYEKGVVMRYVGRTSSENISWELIRLALSSVANQAIIPLQDVLELGNEARMNFPGTIEKNWEWRYESGMLSEQRSGQLRTMTEVYGRAPISRE